MQNHFTRLPVFNLNNTSAAPQQRCKTLVCRRHVPLGFRPGGTSTKNLRKGTYADETATFRSIWQRPPQVTSQKNIRKDQPCIYVPPPDLSEVLAGNCHHVLAVSPVRY